MNDTELNDAAQADDIQEAPMSVLDRMNAAAEGEIVRDFGDADSVPGLYLRVFAGDKKLFIVKYQFRGCTQHMKLKEGISLGEARRLAIEIKKKAAAKINPIQADDGVKTIDEVYAIFFKEHWDKERFRLSGRTKEVSLLYEAHIKQAFGKKRITEIKGADIKLWHAGKEQTPIVANRALEILLQLLTFCVEQEWMEYKPGLKVKAFTEKKRKRVPTREELTNILRSLSHIATDENDKDRFAAISIMALFYTGARPQMIKDVKWEHLKSQDETGAKFELKGKMSFKFNEDEILFVPKQILALVEKHPRFPTGHVFASARTRGLWFRLMTGFEYKNLWARDARKAFASIALSKGVPIGVVGNALNHKSAQTTALYAREFDNSSAAATLIVAEELDKMGKV